MGTQLILTVGTNPLPVWVAWHHLKDELPKPIKVRLVHTAGTKNEMERLKEYCDGADFLDPIQTSAGRPGTVRSDIGVILNDLDGINNLHVHYTGGTKVMGVETVSAIESQLRDYPEVCLQTSYLDPRGTSGPTIISRRGDLVPDTRQNVQREFNLFARLNGFTVGPFQHTYWDTAARCEATEICPAPGQPSTEKLSAGRQAIEQTIRNGWSIEDISLEYAAYAAFEEALDKISRDNQKRNNCTLFHNVYVRREGAPDKAKPFELDVVAVLGYQIVVVSCTLDSKQDLIKQKGMEAILRARQLGGDEARAIVLCSTDKNSAKLIEEELKDEMGSTSEPLQIWDKSMWRGLSNKFCQYLRNDLHWL